jgi:hypothetical protein
MSSTNFKIIDKFVATGFLECDQGPVTGFGEPFRLSFFKRKALKTEPCRAQSGAVA